MTTVFSGYGANLLNELAMCSTVHNLYSWIPGSLLRSAPE
jgi:hypothetical protein